MIRNAVPVNPVTNASSRLRAAFLSAFCLCFCTAPVAAATLVDSLNDWHLVAGHSPGLLFDAKTPNIADGDTSRVCCATNQTDQSFYYHLGGISAVYASVYYFQNITKTDVLLYASPDGINWTPIDTSSSKPSTMPAVPDWHGLTMSSIGVPPGTNYVTIKLHPSAFSWSPQIGQVEIECTDTLGLPTSPSQVGAGNKAGVPDALTGLVAPGTVRPAMGAPTGFSVTSASNQAYLDWFPVAGAQSYNIKRRSVDSDEFKNIATHVPFTYFLDTSIQSGEKYYYAVTANVDGMTTAKSDLVLATPEVNTVLLADSLDDWGLVAARTHNLDIVDCDGGVECVKRTSAGREDFEYKMPGATSFAFDLAWKGGEMADQVSVDVSADGINWTPIPLATMVPPVVSKPGWMEAIAINDGKLPSGTNLVRINLGNYGDTTFDSPLVSNIRITFGGTMQGSDSSSPGDGAGHPPAGIPGVPPGATPTAPADGTTTPSSAPTDSAPQPAAPVAVPSNAGAGA